MLSDTLYIPLVDVKTRPLNTSLKPGDIVLPNQLLASNQDTTVHAPIGGCIEAITLHPMIFHKPIQVNTMVINTDLTLQAAEPIEHRHFVDLVLQSGIIGMGGAGFSTARKCVPNIQHVLLNAMECEPVITADQALMQMYPEKVIQGIIALQQAYPQAIFYFCMESGKPSDIVTLIPSSIQVRILTAHYPSGAERTLIQSVLGQTLPVGSPASDHGILCINIGTVAAIGDAAQGKPLTHRMVTIADTLNDTSTNMMVAIGTPIADIVSSLNIDIEGKRLSQGGKFMPTPIHDIRSPLMKTTNCILIESSHTPEVMPCIRCAACVPVCPEQLLPQQLYWHLKDDDLEAASKLNLESCITCGACDAVCPSHIPLASLFAYGKENIGIVTAEKQLRQQTQQRFDAREARKVRLTELREQKREIKRAELTLDDKKRAIAEALERVKNRVT